MRPFVLRRLKTEVLRDLPYKKDEIIRCAMVEKQQSMYDRLIAQFSAEASEITDVNGTGMMMQLRKLANHPLLMRDYYDEEKLQVHIYIKMLHLVLQFSVSNFTIRTYFIITLSDYSKKIGERIRLQAEESHIRVRRTDLGVRLSNQSVDANIQKRGWFRSASGTHSSIWQIEKIG